MTLLRGLATLTVGILLTSLATIAPAQAASDWRTALTWRDARAQICAGITPDGDAFVRIRINNRRGNQQVSAALQKVVIEDGQPEMGRQMIATKKVTAGMVSSAVTRSGLSVSDEYFLTISYWSFDGMGGGGGGISAITDKPLLVGAQTEC